jgi:hypothetical protein
MCTTGLIEGQDAWIKEASVLNPAKSVTSFKKIGNWAEFKIFLKSFGISVSDPQALDSTVTSFLTGKSALLVGSSKKQAVVLFASVHEKSEFATILQFDKN